MASLWSGYLAFGLVSFSVQLFAGAREKRVSFHMLHRDDLTRVQQQLFCPNDQKVISRTDIVKGYEYEKGQYVVIEPEEIKKIEPKTAKSMEILEFVKAGEIDPVYFESSYYLVPDEAGRRPYSLLQKTLADSEYVGIAKLSMHNREYTVFLRPYEKGIMLHTMYYQDEIREMPSFGELQSPLKEAEGKVAQQLIEALASKWDPSKYSDRFQENVRSLVQARLDGKQVTPAEKPRKLAPVVDLMDALKQSLSKMEGKKKPAKREAATGNRKLYQKQSA